MVSALNQIVSLLKSYGINQSTAAGANFLTASLVPNLAKLLADTILLEPKLKVLENKIPKTKSDVVTLN